MCKNGIGHIANFKMTAIPIYGKNLKISRLVLKGLLLVL